MATPVPGTRFYDEVVADGTLVLDRWDQLDGYSTAVLDYDELSQAQLAAFMAGVQGRWLRARLRHPRWVMRQTRYLLRIGSATGLSGMAARVRRGIQVARGDTRTVVLDSTPAPRVPSQAAEGLTIGRKQSEKVLRF